jgi:hypothetical protein
MTSYKEISNNSVYWSVEAHIQSISYNSKFIYLNQYNLRTALVLKKHVGQLRINLLIMMYI